MVLVTHKTKHLIIKGFQIFQNIFTMKSIVPRKYYAYCIIIQNSLYIENCFKTVINIFLDLIIIKF